MIRIINEKKGDKIISIYWYIIVFSVAIAIASMVMLASGKILDVRMIEAGILSNKLVECVSDEFYLRQDVFDEFDILSECDLNFEVEKSYNWDNDQIYADIIIKDYNSNEVVKDLGGVGNSRLKESCTKEKREKFDPVCVQRNYYIKDNTKNEYIVVVTAVVLKTEKNVK